MCCRWQPERVSGGVCGATWSAQIPEVFIRAGGGQDRRGVWEQRASGEGSSRVWPIQTALMKTHEKMMLHCPVFFQMQCKLFVFEMTSQSWVERGCGVLRLNDMASADDGTLQSRLGNDVVKGLGRITFTLYILLWICWSFDSGRVPE